MIDVVTAALGRRVGMTLLAGTMMCRWMVAVATVAAVVVLSSWPVVVVDRTPQQRVIVWWMTTTTRMLLAAAADAVMYFPVDVMVLSLEVQYSDVVPMPRVVAVESHH
jgi:hypothetical protein